MKIIRVQNMREDHAHNTYSLRKIISFLMDKPVQVQITYPI